MSLFNYFPKKAKKCSEVLNAANTSLSTRENEEIEKQLTERENNGCKRKKYKLWSEEERAEIGKLASQQGNNSALHLLAGKHPRLTKQTMSDFKKAYLALKTKDNEVSEIKKKKTGRPSLLPEDLMKKTIDTVAGLRLKGAPVSASLQLV
eukprot:Seg2152.1 transcript_id=Seg2152.1/GoldUCD/mRNA.D3Y31 product="hypothetical protein" protein_id=Seg2152.1/GoldUCD/D3Y31